MLMNEGFGVQLEHDLVEQHFVALLVNGVEVPLFRSKYVAFIFKCFFLISLLAAMTSSTIVGSERAMTSPPFWSRRF